MRRIAVSPSEAAEMLGCTRQTVYTLIERGELRRYTVGKRLSRIPIGDVLALIGAGGPDAPAA